MKEFVNEWYKHSDITGIIIGCALHVHNAMGNGFQEVIYQRCLAVAMEKEGLKIGREVDMDIYFEGVNVGTRRVDFLVNDLIMVELKAVSKLEDVHLAQGINYLEAYKLETGLLINLGGESLEVTRLTNERKLAKQSSRSPKSA